MNSLKLILFGALCASVLTSCSARENHASTVTKSSPEPTQVTETKIPEKENIKEDGDSVKDDAGNIINDAGNVVEDAGDAVDDAADSIGDTIKE